MSNTKNKNKKNSKTKGSNHTDKIKSLYLFLSKKLIWILVFLAFISAIYVFSMIKSDNVDIAKIEIKINELSSEQQILQETEKKLNLLQNKLLFTNNDSLKKILVKNMNELKKNNNYSIQKDLLENKEKIVELKEKFEEDKKSLWTHQIEYFAAIIAILIGLIFFANLEHLAKEKMEKEIQKITGETVDNIRQNYKQFIKHNNLKKDSKIVVVNKKGTGYTPVFQKIMKLYEVDLTRQKHVINVAQINDLISNNNYLEKMQDADVVIIDNQSKNSEPGVNDNWDLGRINTNVINTFEKLTDKQAKVGIALDAYESIQFLIGNPFADDNILENHLDKAKKIFSNIQLKDFLSPQKLAITLYLQEPKTVVAKCHNYTIEKCLKTATGEDLQNDINTFIDNKIKTLNEEIIAINNNIALITLADKICDPNRPKSTAILYYGLGNFPNSFVKSDRQHYVTFANAASQLYINLLNMLKFKHEIENV